MVAFCAYSLLLCDDAKLTGEQRGPLTSPHELSLSCNLNPVNTKCGQSWHSAPTGEH
jgi:hypothetical protein